MSQTVVQDRPGEGTARGDLSGSIARLREYVEAEKFAGFDPYDAMKGWIPFSLGGKWTQALFTQFHKRNPVNLRWLLGIAKGRNAKGIGLFLSAYCRLAKGGDAAAGATARQLFEWLLANQSIGYEGSCWGYNFDWVNPVKTVKAGVPSVVVTGFVVKGIFDYFELSGDEHARNAILSGCEYVLKTLPRTKTHEGVCFSYTHLKKDCVFNANLLAAEVLAMGFKVGGRAELAELARQAADFTAAHQKEDGRWNYSFDWETGKERAQIDFHQGFVLDSLAAVANLLRLDDSIYQLALRKGARFLRQEQFRDIGRSMWRLPKEWPTEIHNQAQGILTLTRLRRFDPGYLPFAERIASWTQENMQDPRGYFYYQKFPAFRNKIPYMRWAQAWMLLALVELNQTLETV